MRVTPFQWKSCGTFPKKNFWANFNLQKLIFLRIEHQVQLRSIRRLHILDATFSSFPKRHSFVEQNHKTHGSRGRPSHRSNTKLISDEGQHRELRNRHPPIRGTIQREILAETRVTFDVERNHHYGESPDLLLVTLLLDLCGCLRWPALHGPRFPFLSVTRPCSLEFL